jgi:replicative DNA helicase
VGKISENDTGKETKLQKKKAIQRNLIEASYGILKDAFDPSIPVDDLVTTAQDSVYNAISGNLKNPYKHVSEVISLSMELNGNSYLSQISPRGSEVAIC